MITAAAALAKGITPETVLDAPPQASFGPGKPIRNFAGETCGSNSKQTLTEALATSCNTAFAILGTKVGQEALEKQAEAFGFGRSDLRLPQRVATSIVAPGDERLPQVFLAQSAIGQKDVQATPLQMAMVAAGVANGGDVMRPYLVARGAGARPVAAGPHLARGLLARDQLGHRQAAHGDDDARGHRRHRWWRAPSAASRWPARPARLKELAGQRPNVWFIGFAPANDPQVAVAVFLDRRSGYGADATGGRLAAPIAKAVMEAILKR